MYWDPVVAIASQQKPRDQRETRRYNERYDQEVVNRLKTPACFENVPVVFGADARQKHDKE